MFTVMMFTGLKRKTLQCPVCNSSVKKFLPLPKFYEKNSKKHGFKHFGKAETINVEHYSCPKCGASDRERLYALYLEREVINKQHPRKISLIHFAPESALSKKLEELNFLAYRTADFASDEVDDKVDITNLSLYEDNSFDIFICSHVLEHVQNDKVAVKELYRILKIGGFGILMVPVIPYLEKTLEDFTKTTDEERWRYFGQNDHIRLYAKSDYVELIKGSAFNLKQLGAAYFGEEMFDRAGITRQSVLYIVEK